MVKRKKKSNQIRSLQVRLDLDYLSQKSIPCTLESELFVGKSGYKRRKTTGSKDEFTMLRLI